METNSLHLLPTHSVRALGHFTKSFWSTRERKKVTNVQSDGLKPLSSHLPGTSAYFLTSVLPPRGQGSFSLEANSQEGEEEAPLSTRTLSTPTKPLGY